jgi:hypothetical protein
VTSILRTTLAQTNNGDVPGKGFWLCLSAMTCAVYRSRISTREGRTLTIPLGMGLVKKLGLRKQSSAFLKPWLTVVLLEKSSSCSEVVSFIVWRRQERFTRIHCNTYTNPSFCYHFERRCRSGDRSITY